MSSEATGGAGRVFVYRPLAVSYREFVEFWAMLYGKNDVKLDEKLYLPFINGPHTEETLMRLFKWKISPRFFEHHLPKLRETFFSRIDEACKLPIDVTPDNFLQRFPRGAQSIEFFGCIVGSHNDFLFSTNMYIAR